MTGVQTCALPISGPHPFHPDDEIHSHVVHFRSSLCSPQEAVPLRCGGQDIKIFVKQSGVPPKSDCQPQGRANEGVCNLVNVSVTMNRASVVRMVKAPEESVHFAFALVFDSRN